MANIKYKSKLTLQDKLALIKPLKHSGIRWLHLKVFSAIRV